SSFRSWTGRTGGGLGSSLTPHPVPPHVGGGERRYSPVRYATAPSPLHRTGEGAAVSRVAPHTATPHPIRPRALRLAPRHSVPPVALRTTPPIISTSKPPRKFPEAKGPRAKGAREIRGSRRRRADGAWGAAGAGAGCSGR